MEPRLPGSSATVTFYQIIPQRPNPNQILTIYLLTDCLFYTP